MQSFGRTNNPQQISAKARKIQYLLISELMEHGSVDLILPDGIAVQIGIVQEDEFGELKKAEDYCYVVATRQGKSAMLDAYNLGVQFEPQEDTMVFEEELIDQNGMMIKKLDVV